MESELFGYTPGAFTGAKKEGKKGLVELADGGTLFLDEIGEIPLELQSKLLELMQERSFTPIGGTEPKKINVRILTATNADLAKLVEEKKFRSDLYYRLNVIEVEIPPIRKRTEDIIPLTYHFLNKFEKKYKTISHQFSQKTLDIMTHYSWPGNVREIQHTIERLVITVSETEIKPCHLPKNITQLSTSISDSHVTNLSLDKALEEVEKELVLKAYKELGSSYKVAKALNITQTRASRKIRKYQKTI